MLDLKFVILLVDFMKLEEFARDWAGKYEERISELKLYKPGTQFSDYNKRKFASMFWHVRGHFGETLFLIASKAPTIEDRLMVLDNIADELGTLKEGDVSHEVLYQRFANAVGSDVSRHLYSSIDYFPFLKTYINGLNQIFGESATWEDCRYAFAAYELLDEVDYRKGFELGQRWGLSDNALEFWRVHTDSDHFEKVSKNIGEVSPGDFSQIVYAFDKIGYHQIDMLEKLSKEVFYEPVDL